MLCNLSKKFVSAERGLFLPSPSVKILLLSRSSVLYVVVFQEVLTTEYKPEIMHSVLDLGELSAWLKQGSREWQAWLTVTLSLWINRAAKEAKKAKQATKKTAVSAAKVRCSRWTEIVKCLFGIYQVVMQHSSCTSLEGNSQLRLEEAFAHLLGSGSTWIKFLYLELQLYEQLNRTKWFFQKK